MLHRVTLIGNVGQDPQLRYTPDGTPVVSFSLATKTSVSKAKTKCPAGWKESYNGKHWELTTWWRVTCWQRLAEMVDQYVTKGMLLFVEGEMRGEAVDGSQNPRVWKGNDGVARSSFELTARTVKFMSGTSQNGHSEGEPPEDPGDDDLPI